MSSCYADRPYIFLSECYNNGECMNSSSSAELLCKCNNWYNGASDFFDNRVEQLSTGEWLSYSCNNSLIGVYIAWTLWILFGIIRTYVLIPIWVDFYQKKTKSILEDVPFRIVTCDLFGIGLPYFIVGLSKLGGMTFGTDFLPTIGLIITVGFFQVTSFDLSKLEFDIFVQGSSNPEEAEKAKKLRLTLKIIGILLSVSSTFVVGIWTLSLDKSLGPFANGEYIAVYVRNSGATIFGLQEGLASWMIVKRVRMLRILSPDDNAVVYIVKKMEKEMKSYMFRTAFLGIIYGSFSIPYLLPYQTYCLSIVIGLGISIPHSIAFTTEKEKHSISRSASTTKVSKESGSKSSSV